MPGPRPAAWAIPDGDFPPHTQLPTEIRLQRSGLAGAGSHVARSQLRRERVNFAFMCIFQGVPLAPADGGNSRQALALLASSCLFALLGEDWSGAWAARGTGLRAAGLHSRDLAREPRGCLLSIGSIGTGAVNRLLGRGPGRSTSGSCPRWT